MLTRVRHTEPCGCIHALHVMGDPYRESWERIAACAAHAPEGVR